MVLLKCLSWLYLVAIVIVVLGVVYDVDYPGNIFGNILRASIIFVFFIGPIIFFTVLLLNGV